jgi:hypothetical protein
VDNTPPSNDPVPNLSAAALAEWDGHMESVLRGVAHALNNRAASMSALMTLCMEPDYTRESTQVMLSAEVERLRDLVSVVRAIGAPKGGIEAFDPADAARSASAVLALHAAFRDRTVTMNAKAAPVRAQRWQYVRALIVLAGRAAAADRQRAIVLELSEVGDWVHAAVAGEKNGASPYLDEIAVALGGETLSDASGFRIPTLAALRRREGRSA